MGLTRVQCSGLEQGARRDEAIEGITPVDIDLSNDYRHAYKHGEDLTGFDNHD